MRSISNVCVLTLAGFLAFAAQGCKKRSNGIDNNQIITKPYSLYYGDTTGVLFNTNDGVSIKRLVFSADGSPTRAIATAGNNIIMVKRDVYYSSDNGRNFNISTNSGSLAYGQSIILNVPDWKRVYLAGNIAQGVLYSDSNGTVGTWKVAGDPAFNGNQPITSLTRLKNNNLIAFSNGDRKTYVLNSLQNQWSAVNPGGSPLPNNGFFFITHINNTVVAGDVTGANGVWYSTNDGADWQQYVGLPADCRVKSMCSPFDETLLIGTEGYGVFKLDPSGNQVRQSNSGLLSNMIIAGMAVKDDVYKNGAIKQYVYLSTNKGLFRSEDIGVTWVMIRPGNYVTAY